jgi:hypothetical protein
MILKIFNCGGVLDSTSVKAEIFDLNEPGQCDSKSKRYEAGVQANIQISQLNDRPTVRVVQCLVEYTANSGPGMGQ